MKKFISYLICACMLLSMVSSLFTSVFATPSATEIVTTPSGYTSASDVVYNTSSGYIANWGARGEDCTFLSTYALSFYTGSYVYDTLSKVSGGTSTTTAPSSSLYSSLQTLMTDNHTYFTKYGSTSSNDCKYLYQYTDCMLGDPSYVSTLYRGDYVGGTWDSGVSYNQEHIWPQSKCIGTSSTDIGDIMQLRPANSSENSSRGNTAYGESSGYYDPGVSIRGDCARTVLYMYVRWGNTGYMWGTDGVMESLDVLLRWNLEDPVDTWEMGHNDAVQSITGTRNVFVDYPEYAWLLFGQSVPSDAFTPSNNTGSSGGSGSSGTSGTATLVTDVSTLQAGDQIIIAALDYDYALGTTQNTSNRAQAAVTKSGYTLSYGADTQVITLETGSVSGTFAFQAGSGQYLYASSSSGNYLKTTDAISDDASWSITIDASTGTASITASGTYTRNVIRYNSTSGLFSCYSATNTQKDVAIYKLGTGSSGGSDSGDTGSGSTGTSSTATLVTDVSTLQAGDQIIIAALDYDYALSTTQNTNNRAQAAVTKSGSTLSYGSDVQVITLETGSVSGTFAFQAGSGQYLYAPSSSSNHLKTTDAIADNASWVITIDASTGAAAVTASGTTTRNVLRYNTSSGLFSCYAASNTQKDVAIYTLGSSDSGGSDGGDSGNTGGDSGTTENTAATLVTNASDLQTGDRIIIAALDYDYALSTTQNTNNRSQAAVSKTTSGLSYGSDTQIITLGAGSTEGTFTFGVGDSQYLYAASSSGNYLKTTDAVSDDASWTITIDSSTGAASITANGTYTRNVIRYNSSSSLFSCYSASNSMKDVCIYKLSGASSTRTIYYDNSGSDWSSVNIYAWNGSEIYTATWPGSAMTALGNNIYSYEVSTDAVNVIFNDGSSQTSDLTLPTDGKNLYYSSSGTWGTYAQDYYLFGFINGANYACEEDYANMGDYKFVDGTLTATFTADSYIGVKTTDNVAWYMTQTYCTDTSATFYNTSTGAAEKMLVPGNVEVVFTMAVNSDDTITLSYAPTACSHNYTSKVTTAATCTAAGVRTYTCSNCGDSYTETIAATGHRYTSKVTAPTCTAQGYTTYTCSSCGSSYKGTYTAATGHSYTSKVTAAATCTTAGVRTYTCSKCSGSYTEAIAATGHSYTSKVTTAATCTTAGVRTYTCSNCSGSYAEAIAATGHSYSNGKCSVCGAADPNCTHSYTSKVTTAATCTSSGVRTYTCSKCGSSYTETIAAIGHSYTSKVTTAATCTTAGVRTYTCANCSDSYTEEISATGHSYRSTITAPTCTAQGYTTYTCSSCGNSYKGTYTAATGHNYTSKVTTAATCTTAGVRTYTCANCSGSYTEAIAATGHNYSSKVTTAATCTTAGVRTYTCANCSGSYTESISATGHSYSNGTCSVCGVADPNCTHSYTSVVTTAATCTTAGLRTYTCSLCGDTYTEAISATGHSYRSTITAPTCTAQGYTTYTCSTCGNSYQGTYTVATGHSYTSVVTTVATCTTAGVRTYTCSKCSDSYTEAISANGHSYSNGACTVCGAADPNCTHSYISDVTTAATCTTAGVRTYTCSLCGDTYTEAISSTGHSYTNGTCTVCGAADPDYVAGPLDYYLFGYINGYDYACEADYENLGIYKFVNGQLTATFTQDSYVAVKTGDNQNWYMTDGWQGDTVTSVTLYDTTTLFAADKMYVPGNVEVTFTLTENSDGSLTLSYTTAAAEVVTPTIGLKYPTLTFEDVIVLNVYYSASNLDSVVEMGLITYSEKVASYGVDTAEAVVPGYYWSESDGFYYSSTEGIPAKCLGDTIHFAVYCKLTDGSYTYTSLVDYSPKTYAYNQLKTGSSEMKPLVVAMLNYGAAAQTYFSYNTGALVNADLTADQLALIDSYSATMVDAVTQPDSTKLGTMVNNGGYSRRYPTISFEGAFCINYYFLPSATVSGNITMYVWNYADYAAAPTLSKSNATQAITMELTDSGEYLAVVEGIAAKDLDKAVYVSFCYTDGTTDYCSGVIGYSIGAYCVSQATKTGTLADLAAATAVYGYYAKQLFYA